MLMKSVDRQTLSCPLVAQSPQTDVNTKSEQAPRAAGGPLC